MKRLVASGATQEQICALLSMSRPTLEKHYRHELDTGLSNANEQVAGALFQMAISGNNVAASIFWMKTRARWRESAPGHDEDGRPYTLDTGVNRD